MQAQAVILPEGCRESQPPTPTKVFDGYGGGVPKRTGVEERILSGGDSERNNKCLIGKARFFVEDTVFKCAER